MTANVDLEDRSLPDVGNPVVVETHGAGRRGQEGGVQDVYVGECHAVQQVR